MDNKSEKIKSQFISESYLNHLDEAVLSKEKFVDISKKVGTKAAKFMRGAGVKVKYTQIRGNMAKRNMMDKFAVGKIKDPAQRKEQLNKIKGTYSRRKDSLAKGQKKEMERLQKVYKSREEK